MPARGPIRSLALAAAELLFIAGPASPDTYPRAAGVDVIEYTFRVTLTDESDAIEGLTEVDVRFREAGIAELSLDLIGRSDDGETGMRVSGVWIRAAVGRAAGDPRVPGEPERGEAVRFEHAHDRLRIALPAPSTRGQRLYVSVRYSGVPAAGLEIGETRYGDRCFFSENWPDKARHWLPTIDHPYDKAACQMIVVAPSHYQVVSNGLLLEETDLRDGTRLTHWRQSVPIPTWLYVLGVARFAVQRLEDFEGKPVQTWVFAQDRDAGFYDFAVPTHAVLAYYSAQIGPYAYEKLANVQSNSVSGGMESASAIFYGADSVSGERSVRWRNVIIHEIAHQWFGNSVTESDWDDVWLSEGFATYFTLLFREHAYGRDDFVRGLRDARDQVFRFYADRPDYRVVHDDLADMSQVTTSMQYQKGAWVLHMLRDLMGTRAFWEGIREYYATYRDANARTADFRSVMEEHHGQELGWFFDQWLYQGGVPRLEGTWSHADGALQLELRQVQQTYRFRLRLEVELRFGDGSARRETIELKDASGRFTLAAERTPVDVVLDPDTWMLLRAELSKEAD